MMMQAVQKNSLRIRKKALQYLARREHTRSQLRKKLLRHGSRNEVNEVLDRLVSDNILSESRYLESYIRSYAYKLYGPEYITASLCHQGFDPDKVEQSLSAARIDWLAGARRFYAKKFVRSKAMDEQEQQRRTHAMQRRGFREETIRAVLPIQHQD